MNLVARCACVLWLLMPAVQAAETADPVPMSKTVLIMKVDSLDPVPVQTHVEERPPAIVITFPPRRVVGAMPERSSIARGVIRSIAARYDTMGTRPSAKRFIQAVRVVLSGPYQARVRSESGAIIVEIEHPASIRSASVEVALRGGTIGRLARPDHLISARFRAMQDALAQAAPPRWRLQVEPSAAVPSSAVAGDRLSAARPPSAETAQPRPGEALREDVTAAPSVRGSRRPWTGALPLWIGMGVLMAAGGWLLSRAARRTSAPRGSRAPSGVVLIDQLVWRAFERQGYQLVIETELRQPPWGTFRIIVKEGVKSGLLFVGHGPFFEKQTVERFIRVLGEAKVSQGMLVASGSFTVPAQRLAKEHQVALVGREQLIELLSVGAGSEYYAKELKQAQARLDEAKETLEQYASELGAIRRQRNEASWYLGEERARSAKLEAQFDEAAQQLRRYEADLQRWEQETAAMRRRWEESEWYLGESRERLRHVEAQAAALEDIATRAEATEQERQQAVAALEEERRSSEALEGQLAALQQRMDEAAARERLLQHAFDQLKHQWDLLQIFGDRRKQRRQLLPQARVELRSGNGEDALLANGFLRDMSRSGIGLEADQELATPASARMRLVAPGQEPIESAVQIRWQQQAGEGPGRYRTGCKFVRLSPATRAQVKALLEPPS